MTPSRAAPVSTEVLLNDTMISAALPCLVYLFENEMNAMSKQDATPASRLRPINGVRP